MFSWASPEGEAAPTVLVTLLRAAAAIALVPVLALVGQAAGWPVFLAIAAVIAASFTLAWLFARDVHGLADRLHRVGDGAAQGSPPMGMPPLSLPPRVLDGVAFVSRALGERTDMLDRVLRAEDSILERLSDPLIVLGTDRSVRRTNAAARTAFGQEMAAVLRHPDLRAAIDRALAAGSATLPQAVELRIPVPVPREVQATVAAIDSPIAGGRGVMLVLSDRTRERAVERTRADFVANASHELRTPLASLTGFIDTLRGPAADDPPAQRRFLDIMAEQAARMNRLIDDLLSLSRIELTEHQMPVEAVDLVELADRMIAAFEIRIKQRRVTLDWAPRDHVPAVAGDTDQLEQVFQNLFDNALKYGREAGTVRVAVEPAPAGARYPARPGVLLVVENDGLGIPRTHLPRLTERFYRVDTGRSRAIGGTGLGLAIVKHVVNRHRGQLLIESEEGRGAVFSVWLPAA